MPRIYRLPSETERQFTEYLAKPDVAGMLQRKAELPLKPSKPQEACDIGLFGDEAKQIDLLDLLRQS